MNKCWTNQNSNFFRREHVQGHQSSNENNKKLSTKTYLNPQIVNYEFIKSSLTKGCLKGRNKIHVNPNFRGNKLNSVTHKNYPQLISTIYLNSQNASFTQPGTSNSLTVSEDKNNQVKHCQQRDSNSATIIPYKSRFKKVNAISLKTNNKSSYSWCKNNTKDVNLYSINKTRAPAVGEKITNHTLKYTSPKITPDLNKNTKSRLIFKSKTKIINESKTKLLGDISPRTKLQFKERRLSPAVKKHLNLTKFNYDHSKKSSVLRVAKAVRSKYKYLSNTESYKKCKYKIDKRNKLPESAKKKSKEIKDIRKLFPNYFYSKIKVSPYNVYSLNKCQTTSKTKCLLTKNQPADKLNRFQNRRVVKIGGILYKSTTTKLTLASRKVDISSNKLKSRVKKNCVVYVRGEKFTLENNGKALKRQSISDKTPLLTPKRIDIGGVTYLRKSNNVLIRTNVHQARHFVNKAKNKSIAMLVNLRKRSSMPCMIYHRFGKCMRHSKGLCMYKHDPKNIAVCKKFLKGDCSDNNCLLSHQIIQEKMATCRFFLEGLCVKENCPFLHVKLSKNAAICENFLQGFCNLGKECPKRHLHQCPEFDKYGTCNLGSKCHYPHKKLKTEEKAQKDSSESLLKANDQSESVQYYLRSGIQKKRKSKQSTKIKESSRNIANKEGVCVDSIDQNTDVIECFPKRVKLDELPCFIPLNSGS